jgi:glucuronoarabinoxylan endo-1,4-beta-xylanase
MRTGNLVSESLRRTCQLLVGPAVLAMVIVSCSNNGSSPGTGGTSGGSGGNGGSTGNGGNGQGGTTAKGGNGGNGSGGANSGGTTTSAGGSQAGGSGGTETGGKGGSAAGGSGAGGNNAGGSNTGGAATGGKGGSAAGGSGAGGSNAGGNATGGQSTTPTGGSDAGTAGGAGGGTTGAGGSTSTGVTVQLDKTHQTIQGFGINDTWASESLPSSLFSTSGDGIGLSIVRIGMSDSGSDYTSTASADASMVKNAGGKVIGSCWSPPANCKSNNNVNDGGHLNSSCYGSWSDTIVKWAKGHSLYAMSLGNEGDFASCGSNDPCNGNYPTTLFTASEYVAFAKVAGPKLQAANIKVIGPEASEWLHTWSNVSAGPDAAGKNSSDPLKCGCFGMTAASATNCSSTCTSGGGYDYGHWLAKDADAWKAIDILGVHEYDSQIAEPWPSDVTGGKRDKEVWQTEMSGVKWWPEQGPSSDIKNGVAVAGWIHSALVVGEASAWLWWWYKAYNTDDNEGLLLKNGTDTKRHYTLGNYSKFVRPGYVMVDVTGNSSTDVLLSAFKGTDGTVAVVAINKGSAAATVPISISGGTAPASCTPNVTSATDNLKAGTAVTVTGGSFSASLAATTVTTFVCK